MDLAEVSRSKPGAFRKRPQFRNAVNPSIKKHWSRIRIVARAWLCVFRLCDEITLPFWMSGSQRRSNDSAKSLRIRCLASENERVDCRFPKAPSDQTFRLHEMGRKGLLSEPPVLNFPRVPDSSIAPPPALETHGLAGSGAKPDR